MLRMKSVPSLKRTGNFTNCLQMCHWQALLLMAGGQSLVIFNLIVQGIASCLFRLRTYRVDTSFECAFNSKSSNVIL